MDSASKRFLGRVNRKARCFDENRRRGVAAILLMGLLAMTSGCAGDGAATQDESQPDVVTGEVVGLAAMEESAEVAPVEADAVAAPAETSRSKSKKRASKSKDKEREKPKEKESAETADPLLKLGPGDAVNIQVFGRPEFNTTTYVSDAGSISVPLAGEVEVINGSPADAARRVASALKKGQFLVNPQVTITLVTHRSQQVSILGDVRNPGRFPIETRTTVLDLLALAGGATDSGADVVYLIRTEESGQQVRYPVDLLSLGNGSTATAAPPLKGGDTVFVPRAEQYYVYGEVQTPNMYRLQHGTTVLQAITRSGGLTPRGSQRRIEIKRRQEDGSYKTLDAELTDTVKADDVIRVKERIF